MNGQSQQQATSGESIQAQQFQPRQFHEDPHMASQVYHGPPVNTCDANSGNAHHDETHAAPLAEGNLATFLLCNDTSIPPTWSHCLDRFFFSGIFIITLHPPTRMETYCICVDHKSVVSSDVNRLNSVLRLEKPSLSINNPPGLKIQIRATAYC
ncbi:hypothetical protein V8E54_011451 [Elaphomyces granulatus]